MLRKVQPSEPAEDAGGDRLVKIDAELAALRCPPAPPSRTAQLFALQLEREVLLAEAAAPEVARLRVELAACDQAVAAERLAERDAIERRQAAEAHRRAVAQQLKRAASPAQRATSLRSRLERTRVAEERRLAFLAEAQPA